MIDSDQTDRSLLSKESLDGKLVSRATRLVIAYILSIALVTSAIIAGYVVLREEMATQRALSEANTHINIIHRTINASVGLQLDFRHALASQRPNPRLIQVIRQRLNKTIDELHSRSGLLRATLLRVEGTAHWEDFKWIRAAAAEDQNALLDRYIGQMRHLVDNNEESGVQSVRPQIPAEAAGARYGALSKIFRDASEQLVDIVTRHTDKLEAVHRRLTILILGVFILVSIFVVLPLWQRLIREHKRHQQAHRKLQQFAFTDQETGLPNLDGFERHILPKAIPLQSAGSYYLLLIRLQNLDEIYNLIGSHQILGLHRVICDRLASSQIGEQTWSRSSESEYTTVLPQQKIDDVKLWLEPFFDLLSQPVNIAGILVRPVLGMAVSQLDSLDTNTTGLLRKHHSTARMALPLFDRTTLNLPAYTEALSQELTQQNELITSITKGIENREFVPHYQIKVHAKTGKPSSLEVLCRWLTADGTMIGPHKFIPAAEKSGQIVPMTYLLLEQVVSDVRRWSAEKINVGPVAINVSADVLHHKDFLARAGDAREALLAMQSDLEIEITENVAIENSMGITRQILQKLSEKGIRIAIDDFGTGYASLQTLIDLPFDVLKIDRSFVNPMTEKGTGCEVVSAMISLCSKLEKHSVIEGIEHAWQWHQLTRMGADEIQGFFFHKPSSASDIGHWFSNNDEWRAAS